MMWLLSASGTTRQRLGAVEREVDSGVVAARRCPAPRRRQARMHAIAVAQVAGPCDTSHVAAIDLQPGVPTQAAHVGDAEAQPRLADAARVAGSASPACARRTPPAHRPCQSYTRTLYRPTLAHRRASACRRRPASSGRTATAGPRCAAPLRTTPCVSRSTRRRPFAVGHHQHRAGERCAPAVLRAHAGHRLRRGSDSRSWMVAADHRQRHQDGRIRPPDDQEASTPVDFMVCPGLNTGHSLKRLRGEGLRASLKSV